MLLWQLVLVVVQFLVLGNAGTTLLRFRLGTFLGSVHVQLIGNVHSEGYSIEQATRSC